MVNGIPAAAKKNIIELVDPLSFTFEKSSFLITLFFNNFLHFLVLVISNFFFDLLIINLELGTGLFGPSPPLIFKIHATFSGALIKM